jgi:hypothetical protein
LIRLEAAAIGVALDVANLGLEVIVLARVLWKVRTFKVGALWPIVEAGEIGWRLKGLPLLLIDETGLSACFRED